MQSAIPRDQYDAVLLDLDGVITDTATMHAACWKQMFDAYLQQRIAPQLIVVSTPPPNKTFEHMRGSPTLLGWCPTRRRYVQGQQFVHRPAMIGDPSRHGWRFFFGG